MEMSTSTEPSRISRTSSALTSFGARAPGTSTAPTTRSASRTYSLVVVAFAMIVFARPSKRSASQRSRETLLSRMATSAPRPRAMVAALAPAIPPPMTTTRAGATPGTPPSSTPRPPVVCCRALMRCRVLAPTWTDMRPAISLIGDSSGRLPSAAVTVS